MLLKDRVSIITGAAQGIGRGIALAYAVEGAKVALCDIDKVHLEEALEAVRAVGGDAAVYEMDVSSRLQIDAVTNAVLARWGKIDILVNNAGIYEVISFEDISEQQWDRMLSVNLKGAFMCCQLVIPHMKRQLRGCIVNMVSSAGKTGGYLAGTHYSVSKAGLICLTKQLARELGSYGVNVNAVAPGRIDTPMIKSVSEKENEEFCKKTPLGRLGKVDEVANAAVFLASDKAAFITGVTLNVNGGLLID